MAGGATMVYPPTWAVAVVYTVIVAVSFAVERLLHWGGERLKRKNKTAIYQALQKVKEELMLLGFISLLLTVSEKRIVKICVLPALTRDMIPCWAKPDKPVVVEKLTPDIEYCAAKKKVPLISVKAVDDLHIFIFTLAVVHVIYCVLTFFIGRPRPRGSSHDLMGWLHSFWKQLYNSVNKSNYMTLRHGFIMTGKKNDSELNFHEDTKKALGEDFKQVVGISWYLWIFVVISFLINVDGWYAYFWIAFIPFLLLLVVGTKLEYVLKQLVHEVADAPRHANDATGSQWNVFRQSDDHFWFHRPSFVLFLIHFILFQNSFEIAVFFWIWLKTAYSFDGCVMGQFGYMVFRLVIGVFIQVLCSYNTLPLYALLTQMRPEHDSEEKGPPC